MLFKKRIETHHNINTVQILTIVSFSFCLLMTPYSFATQISSKCPIEPTTHLKVGEATFEFSPILVDDGVGHYYKSNGEGISFRSQKGVESNIMYYKIGNSNAVPRLLRKSSSDTWRAVPWTAREGELVGKSSFKAFRDYQIQNHYTQETKLDRQIENHLEEKTTKSDSKICAATEIRKLKLYFDPTLSDSKMSDHEQLFSFDQESHFFDDKGELHFLQECMPGECFDAKYKNAIKVNKEGLDHHLEGINHRLLESIQDKTNPLHGFVPEFKDGPIATYYVTHTLLSQKDSNGQRKRDVIVKVFEGTLNGRKIEWHFARASNGDVWIDRIQFKDGHLTSFGTQAEIINSGILTNKPLDYDFQNTLLPSKYKVRFNGTYINITRFLEKLLPIQLFIENERKSHVSTQELAAQHVQENAISAQDLAIADTNYQADLLKAIQSSDIQTVKKILSDPVAVNLIDFKKQNSETEWEDTILTLAERKGILKVIQNTDHRFVNSVYRLMIAGRTFAWFKPKDSTTWYNEMKKTKGSLERGKYWDERQYIHELAAYRLDHLLGFNLVPVTVAAKVRTPQKGNEVIQGSLQVNAPGVTAAEYKNAFGDTPNKSQRFQLLDYLLWNCDRHNKNWLIDHLDDHESAIDNGMAFNDDWCSVYRDRDNEKWLIPKFPRKPPLDVMEKITIIPDSVFRETLSDLDSEEFSNFMRRKNCAALWYLRETGGSDQDRMKKLKESCDSQPLMKSWGQGV